MASLRQQDEKAGLFTESVRSSQLRPLDNPLEILSIPELGPFPGVVL